MKRRRQVLQVSTFPFLAVLLCAMGSLILLLLVIDRRAKAVARAKAWKAALARQEKESRADRARRAEWERRRRALHALFLQEDRHVLAQIKALGGKARAHRARLAGEQARYQDLVLRLQSAKQQLSREEADTAARRERVSRMTGREKATQQGLLRLTEELNLLEQTLEELKRLRRRDRQTYSLVPYRGRRGENRRPIYVECAADSLTFHPQRLTFHFPAAGWMEVRSEVERQFARSGPTQAAGGANPAETPYLLFLVRPDGIKTYYQTQAALQGLNFDFGYELVEQDWVLDFSAGEDQPGSQPWMTAEQGRAPSRTVPTAPRPSAVPPGPLGSARRSSGTSSGAPGNPLGVGGPGSPDRQGGGKGFANQPPGGGPALISDGRGTGSIPPGLAPMGLQGQRSGPMGLGFHLPGSITGRIGTGGISLTAAPGLGLAPNGGTGPGGPALIPDTGQTGNGLPGIAPGGNPGKKSNPSGLAFQPPGPDTRGGGAGGTSLPVRGTSGLAPQRGGPAGQAGEDGGAVSVPEESGAASAAGPGKFAASGTPSNRGAPSGDSSLGGTQAGDPDPKSRGEPSSRIVARPLLPGTGNKGALQTTQGENAPRPKTAAGQEGREEPSPGTGAGAGSGLLTGSGQTGGSTGGGSSSGPRRFGEGIGGGSSTGAREGLTRRRAPAPLGNLIGNRDWVIPIECRAEGVVLPTARLRFDAAALTARGADSHPLIQAVQQLIDRRQATVPAGVPPYRPMIRLEVRPDGLRSYYLAYPLLEGLRVPLFRQDLEPEPPPKPAPAAPSR
jgi:hypothetical protein